MGIEVPQNKKISEEGKNERRKVSVLLPVREEQLGGA